MEYTELEEHLSVSACVPIEGAHYPATETKPAATWWRNCISGHMCIVFDEPHYSTGICHVCYELGIDTPPEYEDDYHVYSNIRSAIDTNAKEMRLRAEEFQKQTAQTKENKEEGFK